MLDTDTPLLEINNLCLSYYTRAGEVPAVYDFSLSLNAGESVGLVGESGCGKSTIANGIMRYMGNTGAIVGGTIRFKGLDMAEMSAEEVRRIRGKEIAMIYQEPMAALNPSMPLGNQLMEVPIIHEGVSLKEAHNRSVEMLSAVHIPDPEHLMKSYPHQISGGQQQRVVIAMALLSNPSLLLLDEPTTALDVTVEAGIVKLIKELADKFGTAQIYISHNMGLILETCSRVCIMYSGEIIEKSNIDALFSNPLHPYTRGLFQCIPLPTTDKNARPLTAIKGQLPLPHERPQGCNFGPRCNHFELSSCGTGAIAMEEISTTDFSHEVRCARWNDIDWEASVVEHKAQEKTFIGDVVLESDRMQKYYEIEDNSIIAMISGKKTQYVKANEAISFTAREAETVAIVGESGCGKSTFAKVLMGLEYSTGGELRVAGEDFGKLSVEDRSPEQLGALQMVFQNPNDTLNPSHTIGSQIARVIKRFGVETEREKIEQRVNDLLDIVKLPLEFKYRRPRQLSGGQKQRVGIARAFAGNPSMVIADEPVSSLDVSVQAAVIQLLIDIQREHRTTLLFISHDLGVVRYLADRIVVMYLGEIMERGTTEEVFSPPYHPYTEALLSAIPIADANFIKRKIVLEGNLPSALNPPKGCPFSSRCQHSLGKICEQEKPPQQTNGDQHTIACHIPMAELKLAEPVIRLKETQP